MSAALVDSDRVALVLMDYQPDLLGALADPDAVVTNAARACEAARSARVPVIHVGVRFRPGYPELSARNKAFAPLDGSGALAEGADGAASHPALAPVEGDIEVTKRRVSALSETDLPTVLRSLRIDTLILAGVYTSGAVLSTTRAAADLDYRVVVLADCCADPDVDLHDVLLEKVLPSQADIATTDQLIAELENARA